MKEADPTRRDTISRREFLKKTGQVAAGGAFGVVGGVVYSHEIETTWIDVTKISLRLPRLPSVFRDYRIVHVSDLHLDHQTEPSYLEKVVRLVNEQGPDLIAFTGDFVTFEPEMHLAELTSTLGRLESRDGVLAVLGNHDHLNDPVLVGSAIRDGGATVLHNEVRVLKRAGVSLNVCGLDDLWEGQPRLDRAISRLPRDGAAILLVHEPDFADTSAATGRFDLQLSGHSHGGQVRLPLVGAPVLPRYAEKYPMGLYNVNGMALYTNRGLGMLPPRLRFLCRPEITVLDLHDQRQRPASRPT